MRQHLVVHADWTYNRRDGAGHVTQHLKTAFTSGPVGILKRHDAHGAVLDRADLLRFRPFHILGLRRRNPRKCRRRVTDDAKSRSRITLEGPGDGVFDSIEIPQRCRTSTPADNLRSIACQSAGGPKPGGIYCRWDYRDVRIPLRKAPA